MLGHSVTSTAANVPNAPEFMASADVQAGQDLIREYTDAAQAIGLAHYYWSNQPPSLTFQRSQALTSLTVGLMIPSSSDLWSNHVRRLLQAMSHLTSADEEGNDDSPKYESGPHRVDWDRLNRLREVRAHESTDLHEWYAQQES
jgi:hypothetical protein